MINEQTTRHYWLAKIQGQGMVDTRFSGGQILPDQASCEWWETIPLRVIRVDGYRIKKDGTPGARRDSVYYSIRDKDKSYPPAPQWLRDLFDARSINPKEES